MAAKVKRQTKQQRDRESLLTAAFLSMISQGDGFEFTADTIFESLAGEKLGKAWTIKAGVLFRKFKALKLISQTSRAVKSSRNRGQLVGCGLLAGQRAGNEKRL